MRVHTGSRVTNAILKAKRELVGFHDANRIVLHMPWELGYIKLSIRLNGALLRVGSAKHVQNRSLSQGPIGAIIGGLGGYKL